MSEFNHGVGALRRAAGHFALDTAERVAPTYDKARVAAGRGWNTTRHTLTPIYDQIREGASRARMNRAMQNKVQNSKMAKKMKGKARRPGGRLRGLATLLAAGAAVGAAGAAVARRRRAHQEWEEYDPVTGESRMGSHYGEEGPSARERMASGAAAMADNLSHRAGRIADTLHERSEMMQERSGQGGQAAPEIPPRMSGPTGPGVSVSASTPPGPPKGSGMSNNPRGERPGDPALGFPEER